MTTRVCVVDNRTNKCINVLDLENPSDWKDHAYFFKASDDAGQVGWTWQGEHWLESTLAPTPEDLALKARLRRHKFLTLYVDTMNSIRWEALSSEEKTAWTEYRQALLDITDQPGFPENITWPNLPA